MLYLGLIWLGMMVSIPYFFISNNRFKKQHRLIFIILSAVAVLESYGTYTSLNGINNVWAFNIVFVYLETLLFFYFFALVFNDPKFSKNIIFLASLFLIWGIINTLWIQSFDLLQTYSFILGSILIIGCCIYFFYRIFEGDLYQDQNLFSLPSFWIATFVLFFYACSFLFFASFRLVDERNFELLGKIYTLIKALGVLMYLVMGMAFYAPLVFHNKVRKN